DGSDASPRWKFMAVRLHTDTSNTQQSETTRAARSRECTATKHCGGALAPNSSVSRCFFLPRLSPMLRRRQKRTLLCLGPQGGGIRGVSRAAAETNNCLHELIG